MISPQTEDRVKDFLMTLSEGENNCEISRQVLSDSYDFDSYQIFKVLDVENKNRIDALNIIDFLKQKGIFASQTEAKFVIMSFDQDGDGALNYPEFVRLIQSQSSVKSSTNYAFQNKLSFNIDYSLGKLLEKEISLAKDTISAINLLKIRYDFNIHHIFHLLKGWDCIDSQSIKAFFDRKSVGYLENDIKCIIKRLDMNRDGRVDLNEFHLILGFPNCGRYCTCCLSCSCCECCGYSRTCYSPQRRRENSPLRSNGQVEMEEGRLLTEPNYAKSTVFSLSQKEEKNNMNTFQEVKKLSSNLSLRLSPKRRFSPKRTSPIRESPKEILVRSYISTSPNSDYEKKQLLDYLKMVMDAEAKIEKDKIDLSTRSDFNCEDAFRIFEVNGRGFLTEEDLNYGFSLLGLYPTRSEIKLIIKRFALENGGSITYADFFDMVTPFARTFRSIIEGRPPNSCCACNCPEVFTFSTKNAIKNLFNSLIDYEKKFNFARKQSTSMQLKLRELFKGIDKLGIGYFSNSDLADYLKSNLAFTNSTESDLLFIRLDKNRDGKVVYDEVKGELTPIY